MEKYLRVALILGADEYTENDIVIDEIRGYSLDIVLAAESDIETLLNEQEFVEPEDALGAIFKITNLEYQEAQRGNYPPPNIELPAYYDFQVELLGFDVSNGQGGYEFIEAQKGMAPR